jgi:hypothetical protein
MLSSFSSAIIAAGLKLKSCKLSDRQQENIYKMIIILHKAGIVVLHMLIFFIIVGTASAQDDRSIKSLPSHIPQNQQEEAMQDEAETGEKETAQTQQQLQDKAKKKDEDSKNAVKEVKSTNPDMKKSKGARPPYISRPSGVAKPQGAGKPSGAGKPGRR